MKSKLLKFLAVLACISLLGVVALIVMFVQADRDAGIAERLPPAKNVIFFHPDGFGLSHWDALRVFIGAPPGASPGAPPGASPGAPPGEAPGGPTGRLNWDRLNYMAVYTGSMKDSLTGTSHGGATTHAYGVKVARDSFGLDGHDEITALSGKKMSIMEEAIEAGFATALIQTGCLTEPGTAAFIASVEERDWREKIAKQVIESGVDVILGGGEGFLLPQGAVGRHGPGQRTDGLNLTLRAKELGYTVVYNRDALLKLGPEVTKVLGVFAHGHTFNDLTEEALRAQGLPLYVAGAPSIAEMSETALRVLAQNPKSQTKGFFMVAEEEGTDNFANRANAKGSFAAGRRADQAFGVFADFVAANPNTLLVTTADSSAGGKQVLDWGEETVGSIPVNTGPDGEWALAPGDGVAGANTAPFIAQGAGEEFPFVVAWVTQHDVAGGILVRAKGLNAKMVSALGVVDNTDIYRLMYYTLFGKWLP